MDWRKTREYRIWRAKVIRRDKRCIISGSIKNREAHHIEDASHNPSLRFDVNNGVTLAKKYHTAYHTKFLRSFRCKCTAESFIRFLKLLSIIRDTAFDVCFGYLIKQFKQIGENDGKDTTS